MNILFNKNFPVIAEIGVNHEGDLSKAKIMLQLASAAGAKFVKFQSYTPERYSSMDKLEAFQRVSRFKLGLNEIIELNEIAKSCNVEMLSTPLTEDWVELLNPYCPAFKIASGDINFKPLIEKIARLGKPMILSTGGATIDEIDRTIGWIEKLLGERSLSECLILMHCVSAYPVPIEQANVLSIPFLKARYGLKVGYSNHVIGMNACLAAVALGADLVEVHFTDCKVNREFRDHALSFEQNDLIEFIARANEIKLSLGEYDKKPQACELDMIPLIRKGVIASRDLEQGQVLSSEDLMFARPATEFGSSEIENLIGKKLKENIKKGYLIKREFV